jgi:hypothetical protein
LLGRGASQKFFQKEERTMSTQFRLADAIMELSPAGFRALQKTLNKLQASVRRVTKAKRKKAK